MTDLLKFKCSGQVAVAVKEHLETIGIPYKVMENENEYLFEIDCDAETAYRIGMAHFAILKKYAGFGIEMVRLDSFNEAVKKHFKK